MKKLYTIILATLALTSQAQKPLNSFTNNSGNWSNASNWSQNRVPQTGDSVVIPNGNVATFDVSNTYNNVYMNVMGSITVKGTMTLDAASTILLQATGQVQTFSNGANQKIVLGGNTKFDRNSTQPTIGAAIANQSSNGFGPISTLPVVFTSFFANKQANNQVVLTWSTSQEMNNKTFVVERSADSRNWTAIAQVAGAGTTNMSHSYSYTDKNVSADVAYYRIRQEDVTGDIQYSALKVVHTNNSAATADAKVYAYNKNVTVEFNTPVKNTLLVRVMNLNGQVVAQQNIQHAAYKANVSLNNSLAGVYVVQVTDGSAINQSTKVIL